MVGEKLSSIRCHPLSACPTLSALSTVEALLTPSGCSKGGLLAPKLSTKVCLSESDPLLRIGNDEPASRAPIDHLCHPPRMLTMRLLQKAQNFFRKPALPPVIQRQAVAHDEQVGSSRSKRAQIRYVLRQYERGSLKEAEAVDELLKILR